MKPGKELDLLVHEKVMGVSGDALAPAYSTSIAAAWKVVDKCFDGGEVVNINRGLDGEYIIGFSNWTAGIRRDGTEIKIWDDTKTELSYKTPTASHGICIAAVAFYLPNNGEDLEFEDPIAKELAQWHEAKAAE